jgi:hypothetical protein
MPDGSWYLRSAGELEVPPPGAWKTSDDFLVKVGKSAVHGWGQVFRLLVTGQLPHADYLVQGCTCEGGESVEVASGLWLRIQAFPEASIEGEMSVSFKHENLKTQKTKKTKGEEEADADRKELLQRDVDEALGIKNQKTKKTKTEREADAAHREEIRRDVDEALGTSGAAAGSASAPVSASSDKPSEPEVEEVEDPLRFEPGSVWSQGGKLTAQLGDTKFELGGDLTVQEGPLNLSGLFSKLGPACVLFEKMAKWGAPSKFTPRWPNFSMGGGVTLVELPGKPEVGPEGSFQLQAKPLFGLALETSILEFIIRYAGYLGGPGGAALAHGLLQIRKQIAEGVGSKGAGFQANAEIDITITVGGDLGGGVSFKFVDGEATLDRSVAALGGGVDLEIKGVVKASARVFLVNAAAVAEVGAGAADAKGPARFGVKAFPKEHLFDLQSQVYFTGLAIYYVLYVELGASGATNKDEQKAVDEDKGMTPPGRSGRSQDPKSESSASAKASDRLYEKSGTCVLMTPWTWPEIAAKS